MILFSEISHDKHRGTLVSTVFLAELTGILLSYIVGSYSACSGLPMLGIGSTILFVFFFHSYPESPRYLMKRKRIEVSGDFCQR